MKETAQELEYLQIEKPCNKMGNIIPEEIHKKYFTIKKKDLNFCTVNLDKKNLNQIEIILKECEKIERENWHPQEDFNEYILKSDTLFYVEKDGKIIGFLLATLWFLDNLCVFSLDEGMVQERFQGSGISKKLTTLAMRYFWVKHSKRMKDIKKGVFLSATCNPNVIKSFYNHLFIFRFVDNCFFPSKDLLKVHDRYLEKNDLSLVDGDYPFFVENLFPGSIKKKHKIEFSKKILKYIPPGFNCLNRGDSLLFMALGRRVHGWPVLLFLMLLFFGKEIWLNKKIGLFRQIKEEL